VCSLIHHTGQPEKNKEKRTKNKSRSSILVKVMVKNQGQGREMPKSFIGRNYAAYGPICFRYRQQYSGSGAGMFAEPRAID